MNYSQLLQLLLADVAKAPLLIADVQAIATDVKKLATDAGFSLGTPVAQPAAVTDLESRVIQAHKLGDGSLLKLLGSLMNNPIFGSILQALLGKLLGGLGGGTVPTPAA